MRFKTIGALLGMACFATAEAQAQSCLTTIFQRGNGGGQDWGNFMDITVTAAGGVTITDIEVNDNNNGAGGGPVEIEIYTTPGTYVGNETNAGVWTSVSTGTGIAMPENTPTPIDMSDFMLAPGSYGVFVHHKVGGGPAYTNGNGSNQQYMDSAMTIDLGSSIAGLFTGTQFNPRVWNGTFCYGGGGGLSTYCTAKINSLGCTPMISGTGSPSVSATSGFTVDCAMVRNGKSGLLFYKVAGAQANVTFQCGTLCVGPSGIKRTPAQSAGGNPPPANDCSGVYSLDMNAFAAGMAGGNPDPALLTAGNLVHCQWWGRDQGFAAPCNTTLSDGGEYMTQP